MTCRFILLLSYGHNLRGVDDESREEGGYIQGPGGRSSQDVGYRRERLTDGRPIVTEVSQRDEHLYLQDNNSSLISITHPLNIVLASLEASQRLLHLFQHHLSRTLANTDASQTTFLRNNGRHRDGRRSAAPARGAGAGTGTR